MTAASLNPVACGAFLVAAFTLSGLAHTRVAGGAPSLGVSPSRSTEAAWSVNGGSSAITKPFTASW